MRKRDTKRIYAMKVIRKASVSTPEALAQVIAERQVLARTTDSPFLIGLKFSFQSDNELFLVIDYKSGGEVFQHLQRDGGRFEEAKVRFYVAEIILALEYLHDNNIVYRCVSPRSRASWCRRRATTDPSCLGPSLFPTPPQRSQARELPS